MSLSSSQLDELSSLQVDPVYFYDKFFSTEDEPFPFTYQGGIMKDAASGDYDELVILKGRQIGMSWTMGILACWYATMHPDKTVLIVAFNLDQAQIILNYCKQFFSRLTRFGLREVFVTSASARKIELTNGSKILCFGCTVPDAYNVRGQKADLLLVDEAAFIYDRMFPSITPTTSNTHGMTIFLSTAGSVGSFFYRKWAEGNRANKFRRQHRLGQLKDMPFDEIPKIKSYTIPSIECPRLTEAKLAAERRGLGEMRYKREYECVWAGTADQVFMRIPVFTLKRLPTKTTKLCFAGIDVGKVNDPTVLIIIELFMAPLPVIDEDGNVTEVEVPYRVVFGRAWERATQAEIAADIATNIHPRFPSQLYSIDATGGYGQELLNYLTNYGLPCRGTEVKMKKKNEIMLGSPAVKGLSDAFQEALLWVNNDIDDIIATELLFELNAYTGKVRATGFYTFDSVIDRDHMVDALAHAWSSAQAGSFDPFVSIRKRQF
jgi:hypothetical protein